MIITGTSTSRLSELRKYTITTVFANQYFGGGSYTVDGVDIVNSNPLSKIIYYLGGIKYVDTVSGSTGTTFTQDAIGTADATNFIYAPYYKDPKKENIISNPKINDDVFIIRQELSAFESGYRLEYIKNLNDLETYAGGNYFNIVNNS